MTRPRQNPPALLAATGDWLFTGIPASTQLELAIAASVIETDHIENLVLPGTAARIDDRWVVVLDPEAYEILTSIAGN